jgi:hypothetical protein
MGYNPTPGLSSVLDTLFTFVTIVVELAGLFLAFGAFLIDGVLPLLGQFFGGGSAV